MALGLVLTAAGCHRVRVADSRLEFSSDQGKNNWWYGYYDGDTDAPYTNDPESDDFELMQEFVPGLKAGWIEHLDGVWMIRYDQEGQGTGIGKTYMGMAEDPVDNQHPVLRWESEGRGQVAIFGRLAMNKSKMVKGNGVTGSVHVDGQKLWSRKLNAGDTQGLEYEVIANIRRDSVIDFSISSDGDSDGDQVRFTVFIDQMENPGGFLPKNK
jgi:hypothetical protein